MQSHIKQEIVSAASSVSFNDVFSAEYNVYEIVTNLVGTSSGNLEFRVRVGGSDLTGSNYNWQRLSASLSTVSAERVSNTTSARLGTVRTTKAISKLTVGNPFETVVTNTQSYESDYSVGVVTDPLVGLFFGNVNNTTSYTGFTVFVSAGDMTGTIDLYGYKLG